MHVITTFKIIPKYFLRKNIPTINLRKHFFTEISPRWFWRFNCGHFHVRNMSLWQLLKCVSRVCRSAGNWLCFTELFALYTYKHGRKKRNLYQNATVRHLAHEKHMILQVKYFAELEYSPGDNSPWKTTLEYLLFIFLPTVSLFSPTTRTPEPPVFIKGQHLFETRHLLEILRYIRYVWCSNADVCYWLSSC